MAERRTLVEGLREISPEADPILAEEFILNGVPKSAAFAKMPRSAVPPTVESVEPEGKGQQANHMGRAH